MKIQIPDSIEDAIKSLKGIDSLLTAKGWERAATVYAFTRDGGQGEYQHEGEQNLKSEVLTTGQFAALGINGLKSDNTVREYRSLWAKYGKTPLSAGETVQLPELDFPPTAQGTPHIDQQPAEKKAEKVRQYIKDPEVAPLVEEDLVETVSDDAILTAKTVAKAVEKRPAPPKPVYPPSSDDVLLGMGIGSVLKEAIRKEKEALNRYITAIRRERDKSGLSDRMLDIVRADAIGLREAAEMLRRYAAELETAIGDQMGTNVPQPWIDALEEEVNVNQP